MAGDDSNREGTPVHGVPLFASYVAHETLRAEHVKLSERVIKLEGHVGHQDARLTSGAETFSDIKHQIEGVNKKVNPTWPAIAAIFLTLSGFVWVAARYPDPEKFEKLQDEVQQLKMRQAEVNTAINTLNTNVQSLTDRNIRIEDKLDKVIHKGQQP